MKIDGTRVHERATEPERVADTDLVLRQLRRAEVLAEGARCEPGLWNLAAFPAPGRVMPGGIVMQRLLRSTVMPAVGLFVAGESLYVEPQRLRHGVLVDGARLTPRPEGRRASDAQRVDHDLR